MTRKVLVYTLESWTKLLSLHFYKKARRLFTMISTYVRHKYSLSIWFHVQENSTLGSRSDLQRCVSPRAHSHTEKDVDTRGVRLLSPVHLEVSGNDNRTIFCFTINLRKVFE